MKVKSQATENTEKAENPAQETSNEAETPVETKTEETSDVKEEESPVGAKTETEEAEKSAKTADPLDDVPANKLIKADEAFLALENEQKAEPAIDVLKDEELLAKFLANPSKVVEEISDAAVAKVKKLTQDEINAKNAWKSFYTENKELEAHPELVQMVTNQLHARWKKEGSVPSWKEGSKVLAKEAKALIHKIRASDSDVEAVNTESKAAVVSSSGNPAPRSVTKPAERRGFVEQVRQLQEGRGKTLN